MTRYRPIDFPIKRFHHLKINANIRFALIRFDFERTKSNFYHFFNNFFDSVRPNLSYLQLLTSYLATYFEEMTITCLFLEKLFLKF